jgi:hypothetical protein
MKEIKFFIFLIRYSFLFFIFHLTSWNIFTNIFPSFFISFTIQLFIYLFVLVFIITRKKRNFLIFVIPIILGSLIYFITIVTFTERSLTVEMLTMLDTNSKMSTEDYYKEIDFNSYIDKRLLEQTSAGVINLLDGSYVLNSKGTFVAKVYKLFINFYK